MDESLRGEGGAMRMRKSDLPDKLPDCKRCAKLMDEMKRITVREMQLRTDLVDARGSAFVKRPIGSRARW